MKTFIIELLTLYDKRSQLKGLDKKMKSYNKILM